MFSFSLAIEDFIKLFRGASIVYVMISFSFGVIVGFTISKVWYLQYKKNIDLKEENLKIREESIDKFEIENKMLKSELSKLKSDSWISKSYTKEFDLKNSDISKI